MMNIDQPLKRKINNNRMVSMREYKWLLLIVIGMMLPLGALAQETEEVLTMQQKQEQLGEVDESISLDQSLQQLEETYDANIFYKSREAKDIFIQKSAEIFSNVEVHLSFLLEPLDMKYRKLTKSSFVVYKEKQPLERNAVQLETISGTITDAQSGETLPGVNILVKGTTTGTSTDENGNYELEVPSLQDTLVISFIGYQTEEVPVKGRTEINIRLIPQTVEGEEMVVVAMGEQEKASVVGSISSVDMQNDNIVDIPSSSVTNALAGKMAGAVTVQRSGEIGRNRAGFWIRGMSSFGSNRSPLVLVDGVERDLDALSVEEIKSISILKDASATAVYGSRAANGVVLVTTRQGRTQKPQIEVTTEYGFSDLPMLPEYLGGVKYAELYNEALGSINYSEEYIEKTRTGDDPYLYPNVDWFDETFKEHSYNSETTINVQGGSEVTRYFVGFSYINEAGNLRNDPTNDYKSNLNLQRYNFRSNVDIDVFPTTTVNLQVGGYLTDLHTPGLGGNIYGTNYSPAQEVFRWANLATPISNPVRAPIGENPDGTKKMGWAAPTQVGEKNPAERLMGSGYDTEYRNQFLSQIVINQDLTPLINGLEGKFSFSFDAYNNTSIQRRKQSTTYGINGRDENGELITQEVDQGQEFLGYSRALGSNRAKELKIQLNYQKDIATKHSIGGMAMYYQRDYRRGDASTSTLALPYRKQGIAARATYDFDDRYFAEFNLGYNGSENFQEGDRFGFFPAAAAGWVISNESFWDGLGKVVSFLKIKGSVGLVGSEALPGGARFGYLSIYGGGLGGYRFGSPSAWYGGVGLNRIGVSDLTWEEGLKKNVGFELEMFKGNLSLDLDYFHERRTDILTQRTSLPDIVGINSTPFANIGEMVNRGLDGTMELSKNFGTMGSLRFYGNFTYAKNKILEMDEPERSYEYRQRTGHPIDQQFGLIALGYFEDQEEIENSPEQTFGEVRPGDVKYKDINGDGKITIEDEGPIGYSILPELTYGFGMQAQYRNFDVGIFFRGQSRVSYDLGGAYIPFNQGVGKGNLFIEALDRWTVDDPDPDARYPRIYNGTSNNNWQRSTKTLYDGSFLRLQTIELGYSFRGGFISDYLGMSRFRIYGIANNVAVFSKWDMWDPETGSSDGSQYPLQRKFNFGIKANF